MLYQIDLGFWLSGSLEIITVGSFTDKTEATDFMSWINENYPDDFDGGILLVETPLNEMEYFKSHIKDTVANLRDMRG